MFSALIVVEDILLKMSSYVSNGWYRYLHRIIAKPTYILT